MGELEERSRKRAKKANLKRIILSSIQAAGFISVAVLLPNVAGALAKMGMVETNRREESIRNARRRMVKAGLLREEEGHLRLTKKGEAELRRMLISGYELPRPKRWDGKWRVLIFDIPNRRRGLRDKVRRSLLAAGFIQLQHSVWVFPYECEEFVALLKTDLKIGRDMQYLIVDTIEHDTHLRGMFDLL